MKCKFCINECIKKGFQKNGTQKFQCKRCKKFQQSDYKYVAYRPRVLYDVVKMVKRGLGILDMSCLLEISKNTVLKFIKEKAKWITPPKYFKSNQRYEADEFHTVIRGKQKCDIYVSYIMNRHTKQVANFCVGSRDQIQLGKMLNPILISNPKWIYTDGWSSYPCVIPKAIHIVKKYMINIIERNHLTIRTQVKRVSKNFMHQSRSVEMLIAYLKIYFWG